MGKIRSVTPALVFALLTAAGLAHGQADLPIPGMAPGTQNGIGSPYTGLASAPGAELFSGVATTAIPITVPPGRLDATPKVALRYSSGGGRSPFGYGWGLPTAKVVRSTKFGVPAYDNGVDTFVLDMGGTAIELIPDTGKLYKAKHDGVYFKIGFDQSSNYWRTIDPDGTTFIFGRSVSRFSRSGRDVADAEQTFTWLLERVIDPFGNHIDYFYADPAGSSLGRKPDGLLERIEYGGNVKPSGESERLPHMFRVMFTWMHTPLSGPTVNTYAAGFQAVADDQWTLARIQTLFDGLPGTGFTEVGRTYSFFYERDPVTELARLTEVELTAQADGSSVTMPRTIFSYSPAFDLTGWPTGTQFQRHSWATAIPAPAPAFRDVEGKVQRDLVDINGDGLVDILHVENSSALEVQLGNGSGFDAPTIWNYPGYKRLRNEYEHGLESNLFDVNGDTLPDLVIASAPQCEPLHCELIEDCSSGSCIERYESCCWDVHLNNGTSLSSTPTYWPASKSRIQGTDIIGSLGDATVVHTDTVDMNNDGLPDFIDAEDSAPGFWDIYWNTGTGFADTPDSWPAPLDYLRVSAAFPTGAGASMSAALSGLTDLNGDGLPDILKADVNDENREGADVDHWDVWLNTGDGFAAVQQWRPPSGILLANTFGRSDVTSLYNLSSRRELLDVTGDGLPDFVDGGYGHFNVIPGSCPSCPGCAMQCPQFGGGAPPACCQFTAVYVNTGSGFTAPQGLPAWRPSLGLRNYSDEALGGHAAGDWEILDFDGDGLIDLLESDGSTWFLYPNWMSPRAAWTNIGDEKRYRPNLMVGMMNGVGGANAIEYTPASLIPDSPCLRDGDGVPLSGACVPFPRWVVTTVDTMDTLASVPVTYTNFAYAGGKFFGVEREFRGFGRAAQIDAQGRTIVTQYYQDAARAGRVDQSWSLGNPDCGPGIPAAPFDPDSSCNPWNFKMGHEDNEWGNPLDADAPGPVLLKSSVSVPYFNGAPQTQLQKSTVFLYDAHGNESARIVSAYEPLSGANVQSAITTSYVGKIDTLAGGMPDVYIVNRATHTTTYDAGGPLLEKKIKYKKGLYPGKVETCREWNGSNCREWTRQREKRNRKAFGLVTRTYDPAKRQLRYEYDALALYPESVSDRRAGLTTYPTYDYILGKPVHVVDPSGEEFATSFDGLGRIRTQWVPDPEFAGAGPIHARQTTQYVEAAPSFGEPGRVRSDVPGAAPNVTFYDGLGRVIASKTQLETTDGNVRTIVSDLRSYDDFGRVKALGEPFDVTISDPNLDSLTTVLADTPTAHRTSTAYDPHFGKRVSVTRPDDSQIEYQFRVPGLEATRDMTGLTQLRYIDALGRVYRTEACTDSIDLSLLIPGYECPLASRRSRHETSHDALDRPIGTAVQNLEKPGQPMEWLTATSYDGLGNRVFENDRNSGEWRSIYDRGGLLAFAEEPDGTQRVYTYDRSGRVRSATAFGGSAGAAAGAAAGSKVVVTNRYFSSGPGAGKLSSVETAGPGSSYSRRAFEYTPRGHVRSEVVTIRSHVDGAPYESTYSMQTSFDLTDRVTAISYPARSLDGSLDAENLIVGYNAQGQQVSLHTDKGLSLVVDVDYDIYGSTTKVLYGNNLADYAAYRPVSENRQLDCLRTAPAISGGTACSAMSGDKRSLQFAERDAVERIMLIQDQISLSSSPFSMHLSTSYDDLGRLTRATYQEFSGLDLEFDEYVYDSLGRISTRTKGAVGQSDQTFTYQYSSEHPYRLLAWGDVPFDYDPNGRLIAKGDTVYSYDALGRLASVATPTAVVALNQYADTSDRVAEYRPSDNLLIQYFGGFELHIDTLSGGAELVRHFALGGERIASDRKLAPDSGLTASTSSFPDRNAAIASIGSRARRLSIVEAQLRRSNAALLHSRASLVLIVFLSLTCVLVAARTTARGCVAFVTASLLLLYTTPLSLLFFWSAEEAMAQASPDDLVYYHTDHLGSVQLLTDETGDTIEHLRYRAFGELRGVYGAEPGYVEEVPPDPETSVGFGGHQEDSSSGLLYFGARHYDPMVGMFLSPDAARQFDSPYNYSAWDPINNFDADGNVVPIIAALATAFYYVGLFQVAVHVLSGFAASGNLGVLLQGAVAIGISAAAGYLGGQVMTGVRSAVGPSIQPYLSALKVVYSGYGAGQAFASGNVAQAGASLTAVATDIRELGPTHQDQLGTSPVARAKFQETDTAPTATVWDVDPTTPFSASDGQDPLNRSAQVDGRTQDPLSPIIEAMDFANRVKASRELAGKLSDARLDALRNGPYDVDIYADLILELTIDPMMPSRQILVGNDIELFAVELGAVPRRSRSIRAYPKGGPFRKTIGQPYPVLCNSCPNISLPPPWWVRPQIDLGRYR